MEILAYAAGLYLVAGVAVALAFVAFGAPRVFAHPVAVSIGARLLLIPGATILWPMVLRRWVRVGATR